MKGYDLIEALGQAEDAYVEDAARESRKRRGWGGAPMKVAAACLLLLVIPSVTAIAADYFSTVKGDELAFGRVEYRGDGIVAIQVHNYSDKVLKFQEDVKLCVFYANQEIPQTGGGRVRMEGNAVAPHETSEVLVDLSEAYDMKIANEPLEGDWYYLVLTNNRFLFGQDWQCTVDFQKAVEEKVVYRAPQTTEKREYRKLTAESFVCENWDKPVEQMEVSAFYGTQKNGTFSDHVNFAGEKGDIVFAVADGTVRETGFTAQDGNYIVLSIGEGRSVKYGHLQDVYASEEQKVEKGAAIGTVGQSGMAAGPNLSLALYVNGESANPLKEETGE